MSELEGQPLLILGMHRSGTSFLARLMQSMGVYIGDQLVGPQLGNPRGHFEPVPVLEFHQELLAARLPEGGRAFDDGMLAQQVPEGDYSGSERDRAAALAGSLARPGFWGWKEPRTCLFLDLWKTVLPRAGAVIVYRHPLEVHQSLLRREHWDLALFPDQALQAYAVYNQCLLQAAFPRRYLFNANAGFDRLPGLAGQLAATFGLKAPTDLPAFHAGEFSMMPVSRALHRAFSLVAPGAAEAFDQLQEAADLPYAWSERPDDDRWTALAQALETVVADWPREARACLVPLIDWYSERPDRPLLPLYRKLSGAIGHHVRQVIRWNEEAAQIFKDNERLSADYEKMGKAFAEQQVFLEKQARMHEKLWSELSWTGNSWKEQREHIRKLEDRIRDLEEEVARLGGAAAGSGQSKA